MGGLPAKTGIPIASEAAAEISAADKGPPASVGEQDPLSLKRDADRIPPLVSKRNAMTLAKKMSGPTTRQGKEKSRRNAVKHGIFAKVVLLENEPMPQFDALLQGFRDALQPKGTLEDVLVEKLAALMWRYRRMLVAERAEIQIEQRDNSHAADRERLLREEVLALETSNKITSHGLLGDLKNPIGREKSIEYLKMLKQLMAVRGFKPEQDLQFIERVFGKVDFWMHGIMYDVHRDPKEIKRELKEFDRPLEDRKAKYLEYLQQQIDAFEHYGKMIDPLSKDRERMESKSAFVPEAPRLDRILRYSASLERDFDRTLNQLERLQRIRKGQALPPALNVNVST